MNNLLTREKWGTGDAADYLISKKGRWRWKEEKDVFRSTRIKKKSVAVVHPVRGISGPGNCNEKDNFSSYNLWSL